MVSVIVLSACCWLTVEFSTIVNSDETIVTMHNGHCIVPFLAFWNFPFPICEEWFTQCLQTHISGLSGNMIQQTASSCCQKSAYSNGTASEETLE